MPEEKYSFKLGNFDCKVLSDLTREGPLDMAKMFPHANPDELNAILERFQFDVENVVLSFNCMFVDTGDQRVIIDTGSGRKAGGRFLDHLDAEGIAYDSIDQVIFTHGHADHIGGVTDSEGELVFHNAEYWMWADEWEFWRDEENLATVPPHAAAAAKLNLPAVGDRMTLLRDESEFLPGFSALHIPGHTAGMMAIVLESEGQKLVMAADSFHFPFQIEHTELCGQFDRLLDLAPQSRVKALQYAVDNDALLHAYHIPTPGLGKVKREDGVFKWEAIDV